MLGGRKCWRVFLMSLRGQILTGMNGGAKNNVPPSYHAMQLEAYAQRHAQNNGGRPAGDVRMDFVAGTFAAIMPKVEKKMR